MAHVVVPFIPTSSHRSHSNTAINKNIVYSDTVLSVKDLGNNLKITSISDVSEYQFEECLKKIFESNPDVTFNTIQYSRKDKKIYFYTDKEISTKSWEERKLRTYKPLTTSFEILEEIKEVLVSEENIDSSCISLYDIADLVKNMYSEYDNIKERSKDYIDAKLKSVYGNSSYCSVHDFNYENKELEISVHDIIGWSQIIFSKKAGDLYIKKSETHKAQKILALLGEKLSESYDEFLEYLSFQKQFTYAKPVNSNFRVIISCYGVKIYVNDQVSIIKKIFELNSYSYTNEYVYNCNSNNVLSAIRYNEEEIFKRIYVRIDDCPEWSRDTLYEIRQQQLKMIIKKQKRLERIRKIFPFVKK